MSDYLSVGVGILASPPSHRPQDGSELEVTGIDGQELEGELRTCPLMPASHFDWLHKIPVLLVLSLNLLFLGRIMWVSMCGVGLPGSLWTFAGVDSCTPRLSSCQGNEQSS